MIKKLFTSPLLHLLIIGAAGAWWLASQAPPETIEITSTELTRQSEAWTKQFGTAPSEQDLHTIANQLVDEKVLYREAKRLKLDQLPVVERRLIQLVGFLQLADTEAASDDPAANQAASKKALKLARNLGLDTSDPMVRRYMVNSLREIITANVDSAEPSDEEIKTIYKAQIARFTNPARRRISHIYIGGMNDQAKLKATALLPKANQQVSIDAAIALGDVFYGGHNLPLQSEDQLARRMGNQFAEASFALIPSGATKTNSARQWQGPILSSYGYHLVNITEATSPKQIPLADVKDRIVANVIADKKRVATNKAIKNLRKQYQIELPKSLQATNSGQHSEESNDA